MFDVHLTSKFPSSSLTDLIVGVFGFTVQKQKSIKVNICSPPESLSGRCRVMGNNLKEANVLLSMTLIAFDSMMLPSFQTFAVRASPNTRISLKEQQHFPMPHCCTAQFSSLGSKG